MGAGCGYACGGPVIADHAIKPHGKARGLNGQLSGKTRWGRYIRPQQLYGPRGISARARALRCCLLSDFFLNCVFFPRSGVCAKTCALVSPSRFQKPVFSTWGHAWRGPALQRRGPSPGDYPAWASLDSPGRPCGLRCALPSCPSRGLTLDLTAPCALLTTPRDRGAQTNMKAAPSTWSSPAFAFAIFM